MWCISQCSTIWNCIISLMVFLISHLFNSPTSPAPLFLLHFSPPTLSLYLYSLHFPPLSLSVFLLAQLLFTEMISLWLVAPLESGGFSFNTYDIGTAILIAGESTYTFIVNMCLSFTLNSLHAA